eukprot:SAG31_NODE_2446_length_5678_cov_9.411185_2_plen_191_part_00
MVVAALSRIVSLSSGQRRLLEDGTLPHSILGIINAPARAHRRSRRSRRPWAGTRTACWPLCSTTAGCRTPRGLSRCRCRNGHRRGPDDVRLSTARKRGIRLSGGSALGTAMVGCRAEQATRLPHFCEQTIGDSRGAGASVGPINDWVICRVFLGAAPPVKWQPRGLYRSHIGLSKLPTAPYVEVTVALAD